MKIILQVHHSNRVFSAEVAHVANRTAAQQMYPWDLQGTEHLLSAV
jgi:hypothetical protein